MLSAFLPFFEISISNGLLWLYAPSRGVIFTGISRGLLLGFVLLIEL